MFKILPAGPAGEAGRNGTARSKSTPRCVRCGGNIIYQVDEYGPWARCILCGREPAAVFADGSAEEEKAA